jgi:hypothetical protein
MDADEVYADVVVTKVWHGAEEGVVWSLGVSGGGRHEGVARRGLLSDATRTCNEGLVCVLRGMKRCTNAVRWGGAAVDLFDEFFLGRKGFPESADVTVLAFNVSAHVGED